MNSKDFLKDYLMLFTTKDGVIDGIKGNSAAFLFYSCCDSQFKDQEDPVVYDIYDDKIFLNTNLIDQDLEVNYNALNNFFESLPLGTKSIYDDLVQKIKDQSSIDYICENYKYDDIHNCIKWFEFIDAEIDDRNMTVEQAQEKVKNKIVYFINSSGESNPFKRIDPFTFKFCLSHYTKISKILKTRIDEVPIFDEMLRYSMNAFKSSLYRVRNKISDFEVGHKFKKDIFDVLENSLTKPVKKPVLLLTATNLKKEKTDYFFYDGFILENSKHYYPEVFSVILKHHDLRSDQWDSSVNVFIKNWIRDFKTKNKSTMDIVVVNDKK